MTSPAKKRSTFYATESREESCGYTLSLVRVGQTLMPGLNGSNTVCRLTKRSERSHDLKEEEGTSRGSLSVHLVGIHDLFPQQVTTVNNATIS